MKIALALAAAAVAAPLAMAQDSPARPQKDEKDPRFGGVGVGGGAVAMGIDWAASLAEAEATSRADGRPVIAYFTFDACVWCKKLEEDTFADEAVIGASRRLVWVELNRDYVPEQVEPFNVHAFPTMIVLGPDRQAIHRFQSYQKPEAFIANLEEGLRRYDLFQRGEQWDEPAARPESVAEVGGVVRAIETFPAPGEGVPAGLVFMGEDLWIAQDDEAMGGSVRRIHHIPAGSAEPDHSITVEHLITDIATDGQKLYAISYDWTAGGPILVIDPETGAIEREIRTEANKANRASGAKGLAWAEGKLYALDGGAGVIFEVDPATGGITRTIETGRRWITGLDCDAKATRFATVGRSEILLLDSEGQVAREIPSNYPLRSVAVRAGSVHVMEQPVFGNDANHQRVRVWPRQMLVHVLKLEPR
ncbi:MAG: thioredoxin family protein [Phycisphaerales bacterium JB039]